MATNSRSQQARGDTHSVEEQNLPVLVHIISPNLNATSDDQLTCHYLTHTALDVIDKCMAAWSKGADGHLSFLRVYAMFPTPSMQIFKALHIGFAFRVSPTSGLDLLQYLIEPSEYAAAPCPCLLNFGPCSLMMSIYLRTATPLYGALHDEKGIRPETRPAVPLALTDLAAQPRFIQKVAAMLQEEIVFAIAMLMLRPLRLRPLSTEQTARLVVCYASHASVIGGNKHRPVRTICCGAMLFGFPLSVFCSGIVKADVLKPVESAETNHLPLLFCRFRSAKKSLPAVRSAPEGGTGSLDLSMSSESSGDCNVRHNTCELGHKGGTADPDDSPTEYSTNSSQTQDDSRPSTQSGLHAPDAGLKVTVGNHTNSSADVNTNADDSLTEYSTSERALGFLLSQMLNFCLDDDGDSRPNIDANADDSPSECSTGNDANSKLNVEANEDDSPTEYSTTDSSQAHDNNERPAWIGPLPGQWGWQPDRSRLHSFSRTPECYSDVPLEAIPHMFGPDIPSSVPSSRLGALFKAFTRKSQLDRRGPHGPSQGH
ncbi:hypothetical protein K488DRAFT_73695 [Vararia minispora EC-137]|uniref:Uncharacterized protein n=1 Tax=Vararia minispora EC-137 TaxID=1314806 RepID=A0ACB8Q9R5_9AGAM|nr:hypothetical protein K488DRAFT_73695 [Vararia minispora EC-137]